MLGTILPETVVGIQVSLFMLFKVEEAIPAIVLAWVVDVAHVVEQFSVLFLNVLNLCLGVLACVSVELSCGFLGHVGLGSIGTQRHDLIETAFSIGALQIVHIKQEFVNAFQFLSWVIDEILISNDVDWVFILLIAVAEHSLKVFGVLFSLHLDPEIPPFWVVLVVTVLWLT